MTRRQFLKMGLGAAGALVLGRGAYSLWHERWDLHVTEWEVPLPRLPADLESLRLVLISDPHVSAHLPRDYAFSALQLSGQLGGQAILMTGDLLSAPPNLLKQYRKSFTEVAAPRGKYAVLGNHDFFYERSQPVIQFFRQTGWQVLGNQSAPLPGTDGRIWIVGVHDPVTGNDDLEQALARVPEKAVRVVLSHTPDLIESAAAADVDLMLAGHTHGGQVVLPFIGPPVVPSKYGAKYAWGLFDYRGTRMVVTRGLGMIQPLVRFNCPPEIAILNLYRGDRKLSQGGPERDFRPQIRRARHEPLWFTARHVMRTLRQKLRP